MAQEQSVPLPDGAQLSTLAVWMQASRAWTLLMPIMCVTVGAAAAFAEGFFSPVKYILTMMAALGLQVGANMVNDYYDFANGTDSPDWQSPENYGPGLVIQRGYVSADQVWLGGVISFAFGALIGLILTYLCGWPILAFGLAGVFGSYFYTAAPLRLGYHGWGDAMVFVLMGPGYVLGSHYVQTASFSWPAFAVSIPIGLLCSGVLQVNNLRDIDNDRAHGKWTMAALIGHRAGVIELISSNVGAYVATLIAVIVGAIPWPALAIFLTAPHAFDEIKLVSSGSDPENFNRAMMRSGQLQFEFALAFVVAFALGRFFGL